MGVKRCHQSQHARLPLDPFSALFLLPLCFSLVIFLIFILNLCTSPSFFTSSPLSLCPGLFLSFFLSLCGHYALVLH